MRISDWSSDVCSSDLAGAGLARGRQVPAQPGHRAAAVPCRRARPFGARMARPAAALTDGGAAEERLPFFLAADDVKAAAEAWYRWLKKEKRLDRKSTRLNSSH